MHIEKERRFLVTEIHNLPPALKVWRMKQGYMELADAFKQFRVRIIEDVGAIMGIKEGQGLSRPEKEVKISMKAAKFFMNSCSDYLEKTRFFLSGNPPEGEWTLDFMREPLGAIVIAEFEYNGSGESFHIPKWMQKFTEVTDSLSGVHLARLATEFRGQKLGNLGSLHAKIMPKKIHRIALTGGPNSGKSKLLEEEIKKELKDSVHCVPEVATIMIRDVGIRPQADPRIFNIGVYRVQKIFEMTSLEQAASDGKKAVIFDRGTLDILPYEKGGIQGFKSLCRTDLSWEYAQYDAVICLEVPPKDIYEKTKKNNPARGETYEEALALGEKIKEAWGGHPNFVIVSNSDTWKEKAEKALNIIRKTINKPPF
jgi:CYTH domain-containing protein/predicted ATPase